MYGYSGHGGYAQYYNAAPLDFDSSSDYGGGYNDWYGYGHSYDNFDPFHNADTSSHASCRSMYGGSMMSDASVYSNGQMPLTESNLRRLDGIGGPGFAGWGPDDSWDRVMGWNGRFMA